MQSRAVDVDAYLAEVPESRRPVLEALRGLCRRYLVGYDEGIAYGMPTYSRGGKTEFAFASQKNYLSLYVMRPEVVAAHRERLGAASIGKGCIRFSKPEKIDLVVVEALLEAVRDSAEAGE